MKKVNLLFLAFLFIFSCNEKTAKTQEDIASKLGKKVQVVKLEWEDCYRVDINVEKKREGYVQNIRTLYEEIYHIAQRAFLVDGVCKVLYKAFDQRGMWFMALLHKDDFAKASPQNLPKYINEVSFSEDIIKHACDFYKKESTEKAFLVCTKHTELKKLYNSE